MSDRPKISEVFTPRSHSVNSVMYIDRPHHERELKRSVEGSRHTLVAGESGSGKSWLYRHVATKESWHIFYANAANAARTKSLTKAIAEAIFPKGAKELKEYSQTLESKIELGIGAGTAADRKYEIKLKEALLCAFESAREQAGKKPAVLVVDNLEAIFGKTDLMEELGNIILLLDDPDYAKHKVKILVVGVPSEVIDYFQKTQNLESVSNRLQELAAVNSLSRKQIDDFVKRGFIEQLKISINPIDFKDICTHLEFVTLGIAQRLHEYCEILGFLVEENNWRYTPKHLVLGDEKYLESCLRKAYAVAESFMNDKGTKKGRRNQVLYALGKVEAVSFDAKHVEALVRYLFPETTKGTALAVGQMLAELSAGDAPLLRRAVKGVNYRFADPRYLMCLRVMLRKTETGERVIKGTFKR